MGTNFIDFQLSTHTHISLSLTQPERKTNTNFLNEFHLKLENTFSPLARLMARNGRSTRSTRNIFITENVPFL